jgi:uncharacterized protein with NRDE domain
MCLILFAVTPDIHHHLVVAANRDEQHSRPTQSADYWLDDSNVLAGRDLQAGGTWLGVTKTGRFAAVTNFAETAPDPLPPRSRGELTSQFLMGDEDCVSYLHRIDEDADQYRGFNLLISDGEQVFYYCNRVREIQRLTEGFYGLSNQVLDCNWPKVITGKQHLQRLNASKFDSAALFELLSRRGDGSDHSARFILGDQYGTCAATVVKMTVEGTYFEERNFGPDGIQASRSVYQLD